MNCENCGWYNDITDKKTRDRCGACEMSYLNKGLIIKGLIKQFKKLEFITHDEMVEIDTRAEKELSNNEFKLFKRMLTLTVNKLSVEEKITKFMNNQDEDNILERIDEQMSEYVSADTLEEHDGNVWEAYIETCSGSAEHDIMIELLNEYKKENPLKEGEKKPEILFNEIFCETFDVKTS